MFTFGKVPSPKASINEATSKATKIHSTEECTRHITCDEIMKLTQRSDRSDLPIKLSKLSKLHPSCCDHRKPQKLTRTVCDALVSSIPYFAILVCPWPRHQRASPTRICGGTFHSNTSKRTNLAQQFSSPWFLSSTDSIKKYIHYNAVVITAITGT